MRETFNHLNVGCSNCTRAVLTIKIGGSIFPQPMLDSLKMNRDRLRENEIKIISYFLLFNSNPSLLIKNNNTVPNYKNFF